MGASSVAGIGKTRQEAIDDLAWRVNLQDVFIERLCVVSRNECGDYVAAYRLERNEHENQKRIRTE